jgi:hypothetical protein
MRSAQPSKQAARAGQGSRMLLLMHLHRQLSRCDAQLVLMLQTGLFGKYSEMQLSPMLMHSHNQEPMLCITKLVIAAVLYSLQTPC